MRGLLLQGASSRRAILAQQSRKWERSFTASLATYRLTSSWVASSILSGAGPTSGPRSSDSVDTIPTRPYLEFETGFLDLLFGEMPRGWDRHEARLRVPGLVGPVRHFAQPAWDGEPFPDRTPSAPLRAGAGGYLDVREIRPPGEGPGGSGAFWRSSPPWRTWLRHALVWTR